jgi:hypothetical protein
MQIRNAIYTLSGYFRSGVSLFLLLATIAGQTLPALAAMPQDGSAPTITDKAVSALGLEPSDVSSISFGTSDPKGYNVFTTSASGFPTEGESYLVLSTGDTASALLPNTSPGTSYTLSGLNHSKGQDMVQLKLELNVPAGAKSWIMDWKFFSDEFPEYIGTSFNDAFLIENGSSNFTIDSSYKVEAKNNVAYDSAGRLISINTLGELGMNKEHGVETTYDGATPTLSTAAGLEEGQTKLTLVLSIMDLGDSIYDSTVFIDNFKFSGNAVGEPYTEPKLPNAAPRVEAGEAVSTVEGSLVALQGSAVDSDGDELSVQWTYAPNSDVDAGAGCAFTNSSDLSTGIVCTDDGTYTATLTVTDGVNELVSDSTIVTVTNATPGLKLEKPASGTLHAVNTELAIAASLTDAGANDSHSAVISWGDGTSSTVPVNGGAIAASHAYRVAGSYNIRIAAKDDDAAEASADVNVLVYDAGAGFVTGGGTINSPAGSFKANPAVGGRANFGFNSKYLQGATVPTGQIQFVLHFADLNFHSSSHEWLIVSAGKAQFKGTGTVNGKPGYNFHVSITDNKSGDTFRMTIWDANSLVFDSGDQALLRGGSIVIHHKP